MVLNSELLPTEFSCNDLVPTTATDDNGETTHAELSDCTDFATESASLKRKFRKSYGDRSPSAKSPSGKKLVVSKSKCPCFRDVKETCWITCSSCNQCFHCNCVGLNGLKQTGVEQIFGWKCFECFKPSFIHKLARNLDVDFRLIVQEEVENACSTTIKDMVVSATHEAVGKATQELVEQVSRKTNESVKTFAEVTVGKSHEVQKKIVDDIKEATASTVVIGEVCRKMDNDQVERERRKCNVIINKIPEPSSALSGREGKDQDIRFLCDNLGMDTNSIKTCFRAGSKVENTQGTASPRPLVVVMRDEETAKYWHDYGRGYHVQDTDFWVNADMCRTDRHMHFLMRQERRNRLAKSVTATQEKPQ